MLTRAALFAALAVLVTLPALADIQIKRRGEPRDPGGKMGSSLSYGCTPDGSPSMELNAGDNEQFFYISLRGKAVDDLRGGVIKSFAVNGDENGMGMICKPEGGPDNCQQTPLQLRITSTFVKPGEMLEGTISGGGKAIDFNVTMPSSQQSCN